MIKKFIKQSISEKRLEKILRVKQYMKDTKFFGNHFSVLPPTNLRLGNSVLSVSPGSSITVDGWRKLLDLYKSANANEQREFREQARTMIMADTSSWRILQASYVKSLFKGEDAMYLDLLGIAYYSNGELKRAYQCFTELQKLEQSDSVYLHRARCLMHFGTSEELITLLQEGCDAFPKSHLLLLSLANAFFRSGHTSQANQTLGRVDPQKLKAVQEHSHNVPGLIKEVKEAVANKTLVRTEDKLGTHAYTEASVKNYWEELFFHFTARNRFQHGWSDLCYIAEKKISDYIEKAGDIKTVLNFGVFCAVPDYNLSQKYPNVSFMGVDREKSTKDMNDTAFQSPNLSFYAADMLDILYDDRHEVKNLLQQQIVKGEMLIYHSRTITLIYPEAVKRFYKACAQLKVKYIAVYENMALSREYMQYFDFETLPAETIPYYSTMMIHNYKKFLEEAGYEIIMKEVWGYSELLWEGNSLFGSENWMTLGDSHICLLARLK